MKMNKQKITNKKLTKGFTLIELLVVVLIIGILAAIALPQYQLAVGKSRYSALMNITNSIYDAEERFYLANDKYTSDLSALDISLDGCTLSSNKSYCTYNWGVCEVYIKNSMDKTTCINTSNLNMAYSIYLKTHKAGEQRVCVNIEESHKDLNTKNNRICKEFGAKLKYADIAITSNKYMRGSIWSF